MIRNLKVLGLALVAVFAMASISASAASAANGTLTSTGPFYLLGTDEATGNELHYPGEESVTCPESHYTAEAVGSSNPIANDSSAMTVTPTYTNCKTAPGALPVTVTMNGCDYVFHIGETTGTGNTYKLTADLECPTVGGVAQKVEVEVYSGAAEGLKLCTIKFGSQTGLHGKTAGEPPVETPVTVSETAANTAVVSGTFTNIAASKAGLCGAGSTTEASYDVNVKLHGFESKEEKVTTVSISHT